MPPPIVLRTLRCTFYVLQAREAMALLIIIMQVQVSERKVQNTQTPLPMPIIYQSTWACGGAKDNKQRPWRTYISLRELHRTPYLGGASFSGCLQLCSNDGLLGQRRTRIVKIYTATSVIKTTGVHGDTLGWYWSAHLTANLNAVCGVTCLSPVAVRLSPCHGHNCPLSPSTNWYTCVALVLGTLQSVLWKNAGTLCCMRRGNRDQLQMSLRNRERLLTDNM